MCELFLVSGKGLKPYMDSHIRRYWEKYSDRDRSVMTADLSKIFNIVVKRDLPVTSFIDISVLFEAVLVSYYSQLNKLKPYLSFDDNVIVTKARIPVTIAMVIKNLGKFINPILKTYKISLTYGEIANFSRELFRYFTVKFFKFTGIFAYDKKGKKFKFLKPEFFGTTEFINFVKGVPPIINFSSHKEMMVQSKFTGGFVLNEVFRFNSVPPVKKKKKEKK